MANFYGVITAPIIETGEVTNSYHYYATDWNNGSDLNGIANDYGLYLNSIAAGTSSNYGIFLGNAPSDGSVVSSSGVPITLIPGNSFNGGARSDVGIGTTSPTKTLEVFNAGSPGEIIRASQSGGLQSAGFGIDSNGCCYGTALYLNGTEDFAVKNGGILVGSSFLTAHSLFK